MLYTRKGVSLKNNLKKYRKQKGYTQKELAKKINVSERAIQNYENNVRAPNVITAQHIASELGVDIKDLYPLKNN